MKLILIVLFGTLCLTASAQWYRVDLVLKKHTRPAEPLGPLSNHAIEHIPKSALYFTNIIIEPLSPDDAGLEFAEALVMKAAQHNMRFRVYNEASYNFSQLADMYMKQSRYAEAKWFLLQSNKISREENDDKHTIANLISLATIKINLGDYPQAQADLDEARTLASLRGFKDQLAVIEKKAQYLKQTKLNPQKIEVRYAEAAFPAAKSGK